MEDEIDLRDIFRVLWKRRQLIIGVFVAAVLVAGVISFAMPPVYRVSSIITGGNFDDPVYTSQASIKNVMLSDEFLQEVFGQISPNATESEFGTFKGSVKAEPVKDSDKLIEISVETSKRQEGVKAIEKMIRLYANRSEDSYNKQKNILFDQLAVTQQRLYVIDQEINQTQEALQGIQETTGSSAVQGEMQFSRTLDRLSGMQTQRSALIDRRLELQKQLVLIRNLEVVQPAREPVSPIEPRSAMIVAIGGMLGLIIGIFAAFLREGLGRPSE
jgi:LPS O-antigen subunit length determinant protein (WzzB/FepE family)